MQRAAFVSREVRHSQAKSAAARGYFVPSHLANSAVEMGSSFGGSSWTGTLGAKRSDIVVGAEGLVGRWKVKLAILAEELKRAWGQGRRISGVRVTGP